MNDVLAIVIVNYNAVALLDECLTSIRQHVPVPHTIVVVDNASTDNSVSMVRQAYPDVLLIDNGENRGFPAAVNQGLKSVTAEFYLVLNSDVILTPYTIPPLLSYMEVHPHAGIIAPAQQEPDGTLKPTTYKDPTLVREWTRNLLFTDVWRYRVRGNAVRHSLHKPTSVDWLMGAALFVRRDAIIDVGLMDENVFMYGEEFDWAYRARQRGWDVVLVPSSNVIHHESASADKAFGTRRYGNVVRSNYYFFAKHYGWKKLPLFVLAQLIGSLLRMLLSGLLCLLGNRDFCSQCEEHYFSLRVSLNPQTYRWVAEHIIH